jgi:phage gp36-like protein
MYLTLDEFLQRFEPLAHLTGGERKKSLAQTALRHAHAAIDAKLGRRYALPIVVNSLPQSTKDKLARWTFYYAVRELLAMQGVVINKDENSFLAEMFDMIDEQVDEYTVGAQILEGLSPKVRVRVGFGTLAE